MDYRYILWTEADGVATITINRPERRNGIDFATAAELVHAVDRIRHGKSAARCLLLTGHGSAFCSGADLFSDAVTVPLDGDPLDAGRLLEANLNGLMERLLSLPVPVVTAVNGAAAGAGCSIALAGDIIVAARSASFLQAFVRLGLVPDAGSTWLLPRAVGRARAMRMMMLGESIPADLAFEWGMVTEVVDHNQLADRAMELAKTLAAGPTRALALTRQAVRDCMECSFSDALRIERRNQYEAGRSEDFAEGLAAFHEKRRATFQGR